jgi:isoleucyl-tRNA synthetase
MGKLCNFAPLKRTPYMNKGYPTPKQLDLSAIDLEILAYWEEADIFKKSINQRDASNSYVFYEGPPSANGMPGIHHVMARAVKDIFCRFHSMKGKRVERKGGWDTHGLPIELNVEKELGITKEDIGKSISVDEYNRKCRETVMRFKDKWDELTIKMGYWVDLDNPYITFDNNYIESVWHLLSVLYNKGMLYKGYTIQPYSPAAGTGLSSHELNLPGCYKEVRDTSAVAMFKIIRDEKSKGFFSEEEDLRILAWTTTPWTLPSNTALAVGEKIEYLKLNTFNPYTGSPVTVVLAKALVNQWFKPEGLEAEMEYEAGQKLLPYRIASSIIGRDLEGLRYEQLLPFAQPVDGDAFRIILGDFVSTEDGTGIVHIAPSFGSDDMRVAKVNGIGSLTLVDRQGKFTEDAGEFAGRYVKDYRNEGSEFKDVDVDISIRLKQEGKAFNVQKYLHNYPHCWRTDKPILYYPLDSWFVKASDAKERMAVLNKTINWKPAHTGTGRFGVWLENLQDWNLSRSRYWGIPLPIWRTEDTTEEICIGSIEQLSIEIAKANRLLGLNQKTPNDLHRPYIDEIILVSPTQQVMKRELDLIDVWFDSGSMPYAQWHYPFENKEKFAANFPADFIAEGVDQTRGWFYTLHAIAVMCFDSVAYKNVISNGLVLDKEGQKMSKSKGNVVDPFSTLDKYGADATRWYMITNAQPWDNLKFDLGGIDEVRRKFFGTLYNSYSFFALYANIDNFAYAEEDIPHAQRPEIDRWILSRLHSLIKNVSELLSEYEPTNAARLIDEFVDEHMSNWYVRLSRRRFWKGEYAEDKISAYQTLYTCLDTLSRLSAVFAPFFSEWLYRNLNNYSGKHSQESVHLCDFPQSNEGFIDIQLEQRMDYAQRISSLVLSLRKKEMIRVRQPLKRILLPILDKSFIAQVDSIKELILAEVNVKSLEYIQDTSGVVNKSVKPNFQTLGRKLGKDMKEAQQMILQMTQEDIAALEQSGIHKLNVSGTEYELSTEDFVILSEDIPGWLVAADRGLTVALDIEIDEYLEAEGLAREIVNRVQNIRKSSGFDVMDRIEIYISGMPKDNIVITKFKDYIQKETLAVKYQEIDRISNNSINVELDGQLNTQEDFLKLEPIEFELVDGLTVWIAVRRVST